MGLGDDPLPNVSPDHIHLRFLGSIFAKALAMALALSVFFSSCVSFGISVGSLPSCESAAGEGEGEGGEGGGGGMRARICLGKADGYFDRNRWEDGNK